MLKRYGFVGIQKRALGVLITVLMFHLIWVIILYLHAIQFNMKLNKIDIPKIGTGNAELVIIRGSFKKLIRFLEYSWNHEYFGSLAN